MAHVLFLENHDSIRNIIAEKLRRAGHRVSEAESLADFDAVFLADQPFDVISLDGKLSDGFSYEQAIPATAKIFTGPMIAASTDPKLRALQMQAGCTHQVEGASAQFKQNLFNLILRLVDPPPS